MSEQEIEKWKFRIPFGLFVCLAVSGAFGFGIMMLTTINSTAKTSFYAGLGASSIVFSVMFVIWVIYRHAENEGWSF